jgi:hypothetical protein
MGSWIATIRGIYLFQGAKKLECSQNINVPKSKSAKILTFQKTHKSKKKEKRKKEKKKTQKIRCSIPYPGRSSQVQKGIRFSQQCTAGSFRSSLWNLLTFDRINCFEDLNF